jgi:hypothetical protein
MEKGLLKPANNTGGLQTIAQALISANPLTDSGLLMGSP